MGRESNPGKEKETTGVTHAVGTATARRGEGQRRKEEERKGESIPFSFFVP
jgi:hypothetical protein